MSVFVVKDLIEVLKKDYDPNETLVITWWSSQDVDEYATEEYSAEELWKQVAGTADDSLEDCIGQVNDDISNAIEKFFEEQEDEEDE